MPKGFKLWMRNRNQDQGWLWVLLSAIGGKQKLNKEVTVDLKSLVLIPKLEVTFWTEIRDTPEWVHEKEHKLKTLIIK